MSVFVLDKRKKPLMPCTEKRARLLLERKKAVIHRMVPFTIRLKERVGGEVQPVAVKLDPGSKVTGIAITREVGTETTHPMFLAELHHRGASIKKSLEQRSGYRRRRRSANLRYRAPRFSNRTKPKGWLAPSLLHRVETTLSWVNRFRRLVPVSRISMELVRFDLQKHLNPEISGIEYQQGELQGYEVREYLLEKWGRKCAYCGVEGVPLQVEHIVPKASGGSNRVSNLTLSCHTCNQKKGSRSVKTFLAKKPEVLKRVLVGAKAPLRDAAAVNSTRCVLYDTLKATELPVETASGGQTKWNRSRFSIPKTHALDALCVGILKGIKNWLQPTLAIYSTGRGVYQRTRVTLCGFPRGYLMRKKSAFGFQTGDLVQAVVLKGKNVGTHTGRVAIRVTGSFNIQTSHGLIQGISYRYCRMVQRGDGYRYEIGLFPTFKDGVFAPKNQ